MKLSEQVEKEYFINALRGYLFARGYFRFCYEKLVYWKGKIEALCFAYECLEKQWYFFGEYFDIGVVELLDDMSIEAFQAFLYEGGANRASR